MTSEQGNNSQAPPSYEEAINSPVSPHHLERPACPSYDDIQNNLLPPPPYTVNDRQSPSAELTGNGNTTDCSTTLCTCTLMEVLGYLDPRCSAHEPTDRCPRPFILASDTQGNDEGRGGDGCTGSTRGWTEGNGGPRGGVGQEDESRCCRRNKLKLVMGYVLPCEDDREGCPCTGVTEDSCQCAGVISPPHSAARAQRLSDKLKSWWKS